MDANVAQVVKANECALIDSDRPEIRCNGYRLSVVHCVGREDHCSPVKIFASNNW